MLGYYNGAFGFDTLTSVPFSNSVSFTSMTLTATVSPAYNNLDVLQYIPRSDCRLYVTSGSPSAKDPGFVAAIVPIAQPLAGVLPSVLRMKSETNGNLTVRFSGTLEQGTAATGPFTPVPGNPQDAYAIPASAQGTPRFFRSKH